MLGLIPPDCRAETKLSNLAKNSLRPGSRRKETTRALAAAELDCIELRGLKQAGGFLTGDPLASSPYPKALCVSTSEECQPSRCGTYKLARLNSHTNRAPTASSTFVLAIGNITETFLQMQGFFLATHKKFREHP
jgi:hypothetical protein